MPSKLVGVPGTAPFLFFWWEYRAHLNRASQGPRAHPGVSRDTLPRQHLAGDGREGVWVPVTWAVADPGSAVTSGKARQYSWIPTRFGGLLFGEQKQVLLQTLVM